MVPVHCCGKKLDQVLHGRFQPSARSEAAQKNRPICPAPSAQPMVRNQKTGAASEVPNSRVGRGYSPAITRRHEFAGPGSWAESVGGVAFGVWVGGSAVRNRSPGGGDSSGHTGGGGLGYNASSSTGHR